MRTIKLASGVEPVQMKPQKVFHSMSPVLFSSQLQKWLEEGETLPEPLCYELPEEEQIFIRFLYQKVMIKCWAPERCSRPSFPKIRKRLQIR